MADLASSDVTITVEDKKRVGKQRRHRVKIAFGDAAKTYPAGGVPLPAAAAFGMKRNLDYIILVDNNDAVGLVWKYDKDNKKLRAYVQGVAHATGGSATLDDYPVTAGDGVDASTSVSFQAGIGAATTRIGGLVEMGNTAVSAQTLYAEVVGF